MSIYDYNRYDVYLAKLSNAKGSEQKGIRPVVIWTGGEYDATLDQHKTTLTCFCLTTEEKKKLPIHFLIRANRSCLKEDSTFLAEQPVLLHESDLLEKWGNITDKEYRYMIYKTIDIQLSDLPKPTFNYSYKLLVEVKQSSQYLKAVELLIKKRDLKEELKNEIKSCYEPAKKMVRDICNKYNVIADKYMRDLSNGVIEFSLLNL